MCILLIELLKNVQYSEDKQSVPIEQTNYNELVSVKNTVEYYDV